MEVTRADIEAMKNDIKDHIDIKLEPITDDINGHQITLYGKEGRNGLVGDVNDIKSSGRWVKWLAGGGLFTGASGWLNKLIG
jgi:hypothetical protein